MTSFFYFTDLEHEVVLLFFCTRQPHLGSAGRDHLAIYITGTCSWHEAISVKSS